MSKISRWFNSKTGKRTVAGVLALTLVVAIVGQLANWWELIPGAGTVFVPPTPDPYPMPPGGYTCLPTCDETDGKFFSHVGQDMASFAGNKIIVWISVPADYAAFELGIFDGDSGRDNTGNVGFRFGNWDSTTSESTYTLYADPLKDRQGQTVVGQWFGNQDNMPNNAWYTINLNNVEAAKGPVGHHFYRLEVTRPVEGSGINAFKVRSNAYLSTGKGELVDSSLAIVGMLGNMFNDVPILHPEFTGNYRDPGPSTYTGDWQFYFYVPNNVQTLSLWDGDFDRGTPGVEEDLDTDDLVTGNIVPEWAGPDAVPQGVGGKGTGVGAPADDYPHPLFRRSPAVIYSIIDPAGAPIHVNDNPSGTEEWEKFKISTDPSILADHYADEIQAGYYTWHIEGLDVHNTVWIRMNYELVPVCEDGPCTPPPVWPEGVCPRTIGYWKNNVSKILAGRTNGVQESEATLTWALNNVALASPLFRSGLNATLMNPEPIANAVPLPLEDAEEILQRQVGKKSTYPGDPQSMLARALQQNLASWLNLGSGKVGPTTVVQLNVAGGLFEGTLMEALEEAQTIILNANSPDDPALERAKDIGDQINNGLLGEEAGNSVCADYTTVMPPDKQPPKHKDMPEAPKPEDPPMPTPHPTPNPDACQLRLSNYGVEKMTNNPFYGIKFEFQSGAEIKNGDMDEFKITLTAAEAASLTAIQMEAKAANYVGIITMETDFTSPIPTGDVAKDDERYFAFYFFGAEDNGDGTFTLTFQVQNMTDRGLSHVTIGLPQGMVPSQPDGPYQSRVCPTQ